MIRRPVASLTTSIRVRKRLPLVTEKAGTKPVGSFDGSLYYERGDVSELLTPEEWRKRGRKVKAGAKPPTVRGFEPIGVFADWQTA